VTTRPFAVNTGSTIPGTAQIGDISIGMTAQEYSSNPGNVIWYMGPDEDTGYIIGMPTNDMSKPQFWRSVNKTDPDYLNIVNMIIRRKSAGTVSDAISALV